MALDKLVDSTQLDSDLASVANAIRTKGGTSAQLAFPAGFVSAIGDIPSGGGGSDRPEADDNDVILIDFDGRILYSYSAAEFALLDALPTIPVLKYSFLQQDGWNWTLSDAKTYVAKYGELVIGAQYTTTDGKNHALFDIPKHDLTLTFALFVANRGASSGNTITIDWGDGSTPTTEGGIGRNVTKTYTHTYSAGGTYDVAWTCTNENAYPRQYENNINRYAYCRAMAQKALEAYFGYHANLDMILLSGSTGIQGSYFRYMATNAAILPRGFQVTNNNSNWFTGVGTPLKYVSWPKNPNSSTNGALSGYCYQVCRCLRRLTAPDETARIDTQTLSDCLALSRFNVPSNVATIASKAFNNCTGLKELHFYPTTPPTVAAADAFSNLPTTCTIYVPTGKLSAYTTASNYPDSNTYTYVEE